MSEKNLEDFKFDYEVLLACPFCESEIMLPNEKISWLGNDFWYVVCPECSLKYMNPQPTQESYRDFYKNYFWQQKIRNIGFHQLGQMWNGKKYKWDDEERWDPEYGRQNRLDKQKEQKTKTIIASLDKHALVTNATRFLDVGCSWGATLHELHERYGCEVFGIEPSVESRAVAKQFKEIEMIGEYAEDLDEVSKQATKYDIIIFSHVLENTTDPVQVIKYAKASLSKDGMIYIQTPNLWVFDQMNPYHPFIFSRSSLKELAKQTDLEYKPISDSLNKMLEVLLINK